MALIEVVDVSGVWARFLWLAERVLHNCLCQQFPCCLSTHRSSIFAMKCLFRRFVDRMRRGKYGGLGFQFCPYRLS